MNLAAPRVPSFAAESTPPSSKKLKPSEEKPASSRAPATPARMASDRLRVGLLSGVAGYVDAAGFVSLLGLFPAHLTGELVGLSISLASGQPLKLRMLMLPVFVFAVALSVIVVRFFRRRGQPTLLPLLTMMALALLLFSLSGFVWPELGHASHPVPILLLSAVAAMAFQNTFMREAVGTSCPTTVMTGNLTAFVIELVDLFVVRAWTREPRSAGDRAKADARLKLVATALFGFTGGATLGGWLTGVVGPRSMALPTLAVIFLAESARRDAKVQDR
ncbi:MAG TPA: YoaK family protein [Polyangiaceae bacterium]|nr:YoaK family protein [Polyangiaceae bacterium]